MDIFQILVLLTVTPPHSLQAFVYTLVSASAVPVACFSGYVAMTGGGVLAVASTGAAMVQAGFMAFGAFAVSWFLLGAFILASVLTFWFTLAWVAFQLAKKLEGKEINFKIIS